MTTTTEATPVTKNEQRKSVREIYTERKIKQAELHETQRKEEEQQQKPPLGRTTNRCSPCETIEQERNERNVSVEEQVRIISAQLPILLKRLDKIPDPRQPYKIKHKLTTLMIYGILCFVLQVSSRREANDKLSWPQFQQNLFALFPNLETMPHADTLFRLLRAMGEDVLEIEQALIDLVRQLIRKKKFRRYLINNCYPIAIDGSRKITFNGLWDDALLQQRVRGSEAGGDAEYQYYIYVLEASICLHNGMVIPLMSEFLEFHKGDTDRNKQDCETRALSPPCRTYQEGIFTLANFVAARRLVCPGARDGTLPEKRLAIHDRAQRWLAAHGVG